MRLAIDDVRFAYGSREILKGISLDVAAVRRWRWSGPTGPASRRCSPWRRASCGPRPGPFGSMGTTCTAWIGDVRLAASRGSARRRARASPTRCATQSPSAGIPGTAASVVGA